MPEIQNITAAETDNEEAVDHSLYEAVRKKYDHYFSITHDKLGLASTAQTLPVKQWIDNISPTSTKEILDADKWYRQDYSKRIESALNLYHNDFLPPLQRALSAQVISQQSFNEWVGWVKDRSRDYKEKESSIRRTLPDYLEKRYQLARKRESVVNDPRFAKLESSSDPVLKSKAAKLSDTTYFLNSLSFSERESAINDVLSILPLGAEEEVLFKGFSRELDSAVSKQLISEESKKRWISRFKDPSVNIKAKAYFVTSQFPSYVAAWAKVKHERTNLLKEPEVKQLTSKEVKRIDDFTDDTKFIGLHHDKKVSLLAEIRAAKKAHLEKKAALHNETKGILESAASAGYISNNKVGPWLEHVISGERSLAELKVFVKDWAKIRYRFDKVEMSITQRKTPQGLQRISLETFLNLNYQQRVSYVNETERRLHIESTETSNTAFQDAKGKVRHALDLENWDEAQHYLQIAWPLTQSEADIHELQSMENYLKSFNKKSETVEKTEGKNEAIANAQKEITTVLNLLPVSLQAVYRKALTKGPECLHCVATCVYNRTWCEERDFLDAAMEERLRAQSIQETENRIRAGGEGHQNGVENNFVDGHHQPAIRDKGVGPQNLFMSSSGADAFVEKADANKNNFSFWYWTNLIVDGVSSSQNSYVSYALNHRIKRAARTLDSYGLKYNPVINIAGPANPSVN